MSTIWAQRGLLAAVFFYAWASTACSDDDTTSGMVDVDMGTQPDSGSPDLGPPRLQCPEAMRNPGCADQVDCADFEPSSTCGDCPGFNTRNFCVYDPDTHAACERMIDVQNVTVNVPITIGNPSLRNDIAWFVAVAVGKETSGGASLSCADFYADPLGFQPNAMCQNVALSVRISKSAAQQGGAFLTQFTRIPPRREYLFLVYGYETEDFTQDPIGVYCTELENGPLPPNDNPDNYPVEVGPIIGGEQDMIAP